MRAVLERISPVLIASVLAGGFVVASALPAVADPRDERRDRLHAERPIAALIETPVHIHPDLAAQIEQAEAEERAAAEAWYAGVMEAEARSKGWTPASASSGSRSGGGCNGDVACFLECTRAHESDTSGGYGAVSSSGTYRGAYQFRQDTWDAAVSGAGWAEYAGVPADEVPAEIQDAAAAHLYSVSGTRPWGGRC